MAAEWRRNAPDELFGCRLCGRYGRGRSASQLGSDLCKINFHSLDLRSSLRQFSGSFACALCFQCSPQRSQRIKEDFHASLLHSCKLRVRPLQSPLPQSSWSSCRHLMQALPEATECDFRQRSLLARTQEPQCRLIGQRYKPHPSLSPCRSTSSRSPSSLSLLDRRLLAGQPESADLNHTHSPGGWRRPTPRW